MKKFDEALEIDIVKELANGTCGDLIRYFDANGIEPKKESEDELVKVYWKIAKIETRTVYECKNFSDYEKLKEEIEEARKLLREKE